MAKSLFETGRQIRKARGLFDPCLTVPAEEEQAMASGGTALII